MHAMHATLLLAVVWTASAVAWTWSPIPAPMFLSYVRPRRAPVSPGVRPPLGSPLGPPMPPGPQQVQQGMPLYPTRALSFSGYFSGAGVPQSQPGDPYAFTWGPALRRIQEEGSVAEAPEPPQQPPPQEEEAALGGTMEPAAEAAPPNDADESVDSNGNGFETRAKQDPGRKQPRPSYPAPAPGPPRAPSVPPSAPEGPGGNGDQDNGDDRGGYGTINAWFPFMFSGGWPMGGQNGGGRGYGAPNNPSPPPSYGAPNNPSSPPSYGAPNNSSPPPSYGAPPSSSNPGQGNTAQGRPSGAAGGQGGYYPVAIANSFSTGRNAVASSTATAYGGGGGAAPNRPSQ